MSLLSRIVARKKSLNIEIGPIGNPAPSEKDRSPHELICSICQCEFDIECEGGIDGYIGILPVAFCPMCFSGMVMFFTELHGCGDEDEGYEDHNED